MTSLPQERQTTNDLSWVVRRLPFVAISAGGGQEVLSNSRVICRSSVVIRLPLAYTFTTLTRVS